VICSSNPRGIVFAGHGSDEIGAGRENLRRESVLWLWLAHLVLILALATGTSWAAGSQPAGQQPDEAASQFGAITPYLGLTIDEIELQGSAPEERGCFLALQRQKKG